MRTDPIANFITGLRNATRARRSEVTSPSSKMIRAIAQVLKSKRFIEDFSHGMQGSFPEITVLLRTDREPLELRRVSKPGQRIYVSAENVKRVRNSLGIGIYSTSSGILSDQEARDKKVGGEYLCEVY